MTTASRPPDPGPSTDPSPDLTLSHIEFVVDGGPSGTRRLLEDFGFAVLGSRTREQEPHGASRVTVMRSGSGTPMVLTEALSQEHPGAGYLAAHGEGVADIAFSTPDADAAYRHATAAGGIGVMAPREIEGVIRCQVRAFGDVVHTIYQTDGTHPLALTEGVALTGPADEPPGDLGRVDHIAVCLASGDLAPVVEQYTNALGFAVIFEERVQVGDQAMNSKVVQGGNGRLTLTLLEPDADALPGQIDDFLKEHGDAGVQHVALESADIVAAVRRLKGVGVPFLTPVPAYYDIAGGRIEPSSHAIADLAAQGILFDEDHNGQLYQIFTRSLHPRGTLFFEVVERAGARTFGSGNIRALYESVEISRTGSAPGPRREGA